MKIKPHIFIMFLLLLTLLVFYHPLLSSTQVTTGADMTSLFYPMKVFFADSLRQGIIPLWNPYKFSGSPFLASMQTGVFYPLNWLLFSWSSPIAGINLYILFHLWLLSVFFYLLLYSGFGIPSGVAYIFSFVVSLSGIAYARIEHLAGLAVLSWSPLVILAFLLFLQSRAILFLYLLVISFAMQILAGHPQYMAYNFFFLLLFSLFWLFTNRDLEFKKRLWRLFLLFLAFLSSFLITAVQLLPMLEHQRLTYRAVSGFGYTASFSMPPKFLLTFINPYFFRHEAMAEGLPRAFPEFNCYFGLIPLIIFLISSFYFFKRRLPLEIFLFLISFFFIIFALGSYTPVFKVVLSIFPFLQGFRVPARILFLVIFIWVILGAKFLSQLLLPKLSSQISLLLLFLLFIIIFADLYYNSRREAFNYTTDIISLRREKFGWEEYLLPSAFSLQPANFRIFRLMTRDDDYYLSPISSAVRQRFLRLQPDGNLLFSCSLIDGYEEGLLPAIRYKDFLLTYNRNLRNPNPDTFLLALLNARYIYSELPISSSNLRLIKTINEELKIFENLEWQGPVFWKAELDRLFQLEFLDGSFIRYGELQYTFGNEFLFAYRKTAGEKLPEELSRGLKGVWKNPNEIILNCSSGKGELAISLPAYPGWFAYASNGSRKKLKPINAILQILPDISSPTELSIRYQPFSFRLGLYISLLSFSFLIFTLIVYHRDKLIHR